jgi:hypothetical protein
MTIILAATMPIDSTSLSWNLAFLREVVKCER